MRCGLVVTAAVTKRGQIRKNASSARPTPTSAVRVHPLLAGRTRASSPSAQTAISTIMCAPLRCRFDAGVAHGCAGLATMRVGVAFADVLADDRQSHEDDWQSVDLATATAVRVSEVISLIRARPRGRARCGRTARGGRTSVCRVEFFFVS